MCQFRYHYYPKIYHFGEEPFRGCSESIFYITLRHPTPTSPFCLSNTLKAWVIMGGGEQIRTAPKAVFVSVDFLSILLNFY